MTSMTRLHDEALVLDRHDYQDRHVVLTLLTRRSGLLRGMLRNARGAKPRYGAVTQVLSHVRFDAFAAPHAQLATFRSMDPVRLSYGLTETFDGAVVAAAVAELLLTYCPPGEPDERPFRLGLTLLDGLLTRVDPPVVLAYAEHWVLRLAGLFPQLDSCSCCGNALPAAAAVRLVDDLPRCSTCAPNSSHLLSVHAVSFLGSCRHQPVAAVAPPVPGEVAAWLDRMVRMHAERPLKALDFLARLSSH